MIGALVVLFIAMWRYATMPNDPPLACVPAFVLAVFLVLLGAAAESGARYLWTVIHAA